MPASKIVEPTRNAIRLTRCFLGYCWSPLGEYDTTGETKSATGPTRSLEIVLERESTLTCVDVAESADGMPTKLVPEGDEAGGRDSTIVPILESTISH